MQFKRRRELKRTRIEIIPMIDTMFFLLVFFMLSSLALTRLNGLPVNLPQASSAAKQAPAPLTITLDSARKIYVNKTPVTFATLESTLVEKAGGAGADLASATVIINADASVPHGDVVRCIDGAREVGIAKFAIATAPESAANAPVEAPR
jgi:biopolymer transport protein ExbD